MEAERLTDLKEYVNRRPKAPTVKTIEDLIQKHARDARRKIEGGKKIKHRRFTDDSICVSAVHSNVLRALQVRMSMMPKFMYVHPRRNKNLLNIHL